jgi:hypothetical protein
VEIESGSLIPLDVPVIMKETTLTAKVSMKPTHTSQYINFNSNRQPHVKRCLIQSPQELTPYTRINKKFVQ